MDNSTKAFLILSAKEYSKLISTRELHAERCLWDFSRIQRNKNWIIKKYQERTSMSTKGLWHSHSILHNEHKDVNDYAEMYLADKEWVLVEFNVPTELCLFMHQSASYTLDDVFYVAYNEAEYMAFKNKWDEKGKPYGLDYSCILYAKDKKFKTLRAEYLDDIIKSFDKLLDLQADVDEVWYGPINPTPWFPYVRSNWIVSTHRFRGSEYQKWIGPHKVDAATYPPLAGYGDNLKIGDTFTSEYCDAQDNRIHKLIGWEETEHGFIHVYTKTPDKSICSFCANPVIGGNRIFTKQ